MRAPLTQAALAKAGVKFGVKIRDETAAGHVDRTVYSLHGSDDRQALLSWVMNGLPAQWDDVEVAARLPAVLAEYEPQLPAYRAAGDRPGYQAVLRAAVAALFD